MAAWCCEASAPGATWGLDATGSGTGSSDSSRSTRRPPLPRVISVSAAGCSRPVPRLLRGRQVAHGRLKPVNCPRPTATTVPPMFAWERRVGRSSARPAAPATLRPRS
jgi:hypothetical protein